MLAAIIEIDWHDPLVAVPAFLTLVLIPFTYSIANGLGFGIIAWAVLHLAAGKLRRQDWLLYLLAALFLARFIYLGANYLGARLAPSYPGRWVPRTCWVPRT